jgi:hypothetical protein
MPTSDGLLIAPAIQFLVTRGKKTREKLLRREADIERNGAP